MCARVFDLFTEGFIHPGTPRAKFPPSSSRCASVLNAGVDMRQRGWAVLNKFPAPDVSVATVSKPYPSVTCCGSGCIGSLVYVCALHRIHLPVVWVLFYGCLEKSNAVCFIWDHGPWFLRVLRNIQPHPLIVKRVGLHLSSEECFLLSHDNKVLTYALSCQNSSQKNI